MRHPGYRTLLPIASPCPYCRSILWVHTVGPTPSQVSDVILLSPTHDVGARNKRRLVAVYSNKESGFEVVHGMLNRIMETVGVPFKGESEIGEVTCMSSLFI